MAFVLDTSVAVAWFARNQAGPETQDVLRRLRNEPAFVPAYFAIEVARALRTLERRDVMRADDVDVALTELAALRLNQDSADALHLAGSIISLARRHDLRIADAAYLELALRLGVPLATRDAKLRQAATAAGVASIIS
jgi:predicted nucleic acid-binding protein